MGNIVCGLFGKDEDGSSKQAAKKYQTSSTETEKPIPSWEKRKKLDYRDFMFSKQQGQTLIKAPQSISGQAEMVIEDCDNCRIFILDHTVQVTVDQCRHCLIFIGPCEGSVFLRNCEDCTVFAACQQFRTRDCKRLELHLFCQTQPSIETSSELKFACLQTSYPQMKEQFKAAKLSPWNNEWFNIHDFNSASGRHFSFLDTSYKSPADMIPADIISQYQLTMATSMVPRIEGTMHQGSEKTLFVVIYTNENEEALLNWLVKQGKCIRSRSAAVTATLKDFAKLNAFFRSASAYIALELADTVNAGPEGMGCLLIHQNDEGYNQFAELLLVRSKEM